MLPMFLPSCMFLLLLPPETSGSQGHRQVRQERGLLPARHELLRLAKLYKHRGRLKLVCSCAPQRCHGEVVAEAITGILAKGWV